MAKKTPLIQTQNNAEEGDCPVDIKVICKSTESANAVIAASGITFRRTTAKNGVNWTGKTAGNRKIQVHVAAH